MTTTPQPQPTSAPRVATFRTVSGRVLEGLLVAWLGVAAVAFAFGLMQRSLIRRLQSDPLSVTLSDVRADDARAQLVNVTCTVLLVLTGLVFLAWTYLQYRRLDDLRARKAYANGWAIGGWLVPFANLYVPVRVVNDIWNGTVGWEREHRAAVPGEPRGSGRGLPVVGLWWAAYLGGGFVALRASSAEHEIHGVADALDVNAMYLGRDALLFAAAGLALVIVHSVNRARPTGGATAIPELDVADLDTHDRFWR